MKNIKNVVYSFEGVPDGDKLIMTGITSSLGIKYVELEYSKEFLGKSVKTCRRAIEKIKSKHGIQKRYWSRAVIVQDKTFVSRLLLEKRKKRKKGKRSQKLLDGYIQMLSQIKWKIAGSVRCKFDKTLEENRTIIENLNLFLKGILGEKFTLFYVIEANDPLFTHEKEPHHIHYMISFDDSHDVKSIIDKIELHCLFLEDKDRNSCWCKTYNPEQDYIKYCANKIKPRRDNYYVFSNEDLCSAQLELTKLST